MTNPDFIFAPYEILSDDRLTLRQIRVLLAILSWRKKNTMLARVSRESLSEKTGYLPNKISEITRQLEDLGWIRKVGKGGQRKWTLYEILDLDELPEDEQTVPKSGIVPRKETVPKSGTVSDTNGTQIGYRNKTQTVPKSGSQTVPKSGTPIQTVTNTVTKEKIKKENSVIENYKFPRRVKIPEMFHVTKAHVEFAKFHKLTDPHDCILAFVAHHQGMGTLADDWDAMFRKWLAMDRDFKKRGNGYASGNSGFARRNVSEQASNNLREIWEEYNT